MDNIIRGIFAVEKNYKQKLILIQTLKPHLLKLDGSTADKVSSACLCELLDHSELATRKLAVQVLTILYLIYPEKTLALISVHDADNKEFLSLCSKLILKSLSTAQLSYTQGRKIGEMLLSKKMLPFSEHDVDLIIRELQVSKHWFSDSSSWLEVLFHYCGLSNQGNAQVTDLISSSKDQTTLVTLLRLIAIRLADGSLSIIQGEILSRFRDKTIVQTASQEFLRSLSVDTSLSKCFDNLISLQKQGVSLSHWIVSLICCICSDKRYILAIQLAERMTTSILEDRLETLPLETQELVCKLLLFHQHSPFLFHRNLAKLAAHTSADQVSRTVQCLMMRYPHFRGLYGKTGNTVPFPWPDLHQTLSDSHMRLSSGVGFNNMGNTCYFNSLIQALWLSIPFQCDVVFNRLDSSLLSELRRVFLNLSYSVRTSFSPDTLFHVLRPPWFAFGDQQDPAELLRHVFDQISTGGGAGSTNSSNSLQNGLLGGRDLGSLESSKYRALPPKPDPGAPTQPSQIITRHFEGAQQVTLVCETCGTSSAKQETFLFLSLPCRRESTSLRQLILESLATEQLAEENQYFCDKCGGKSDAVRKTCLSRLPSTFILTINRFSYDKELKCRSKLLTKVEVPSELKFTPAESSFELNTSLESHPNDRTYQLYASVVHSGSTTESGHYFTYGLPASHASSSVLQSCLCFNDSSVTMVTGDMVNEPRSPFDTPYILFYQKVPVELAPLDLGLSDLSEILNSNIRYLKLKESESGPSMSGKRKEPGPGSEPDDEDGKRDTLPRGCHGGEFAGGSSRFIF